MTSPAAARPEIAQVPASAAAMVTSRAVTMTPARTPARTSGGTADHTGRVTSRQRPPRTTPEPSPTAAIRTAPSRVRITEPVPAPRGPASETASRTTTTTARYPPIPASHADRTGWADLRADAWAVKRASAVIPSGTRLIVAPSTWTTPP